MSALFGGIMSAFTGKTKAVNDDGFVIREGKDAIASFPDCDGRNSLVRVKVLEIQDKSPVSKWIKVQGANRDTRTVVPNDISDPAYNNANCLSIPEL